MESLFPKRFFVSYSRKDSSIVRPIVEIMRATGTSVFRDEDSIPPGKRWRDVLSLSIQEADVIVLFWSKNSASSSAVASEYNQGITLGKDIIPILIDNEPLSSVLSEFQYIDLRSVFHPELLAGNRWSLSPIENANNLFRAIGVRPVKRIKRIASPHNDIFIVHSIQSVNNANKLSKEIQKFDLTVQQWSIPQYNFEWLSPDVYKQMRDSRIVILVITHDDLRKPHMKNIGIALLYMGTRFIPVLVDCEPMELPNPLSMVHGFRFRDRKKYLRDIKQLIK